MKLITSATYQKKIVIALLFSVLVLFALYMYFLSASVMHVVMRTEAEYSIRTLRSDISELESRFITAQHSVSQQIASLDGYEDISEKVFIDRTDDNVLLTTNTVLR